MDTDQERRKEYIREKIAAAKYDKMPAIQVDHTRLDSSFHNELQEEGYKILYNDKALIYTITWAHWPHDPIDTEPDGYFNKVANNHLPPSGY